MHHKTPLLAKNNAQMSEKMANDVITGMMLMSGNI